MKLHGFFRSGSSHRLRIALHLKGLNFETAPINLRAREHLSATFAALNPQQLVPVLIEGAQVLTQSLSIIEWLEERYPDPPLLPRRAADRARVRAMAALIACDIHPLNNRRVLEYLRGTLGCDEAQVNAWCRTWIRSGFDALERMLAGDLARGPFCFGQAPTLADACLIPQVESARRFEVNLAAYPNILAIDRHCGDLESFRRAAPQSQPDAL